MDAQPNAPDHRETALPPPAERISVMVSDVDGTLVTPQKELTPGAIEAVRQLRSAGIGFSITSSRPPRGLTMLLGPLAIQDPFAAFNGGAVVMPDLTVIEERVVPLPAAHTAVERIIAHGADIWVFSEGDWFVTDPQGAYVDHELKTVRFAPRVVTSFEPYLGRANKIVGVSGDFARLERCEAELREALGDSALAVRSQRYYLDVTHAEANKGHAVEVLARHFGVPLEEVAVIGDMANDLSMFSRAGLAIAMGNAVPDIQAQAHFVTSPNTEDGFAAAVERFVLPRAAGSALRAKSPVEKT